MSKKDKFWSSGFVLWVVLMLFTFHLMGLI